MASPLDHPSSRIPAWTVSWKPWAAVTVGVVVILVIGTVDMMIEPQLSSAFFYLLPILFVSRHASTRAAMICSILATLVSLNADLVTSHSRDFSYLPFANSALRLGVLLVVVRLVRSMRELNDSLEERVRDRTSRLAAEVRERIKLENRILEVRESEQARIGQDLHDGLCQHLVATAFSASMLQKKLEENGDAESGNASRIVGLIDESITQARDLAKGLYPVRLEEEGLETALQALANTINKRADLRCTLALSDEPSGLDKGVTIQLYRIAQEAVNNVVKHANASKVKIQFDTSGGTFDLRISDDGTGMRNGALSGEGMGLHIMEYRAKAIGAKLEISPGKDGVMVRCVSTDDSSNDE